jgi:hypothetical protein
MNTFNIAKCGGLPTRDRPFFPSGFKMLLTSSPPILFLGTPAETLATLQSGHN